MEDYVNHGPNMEQPEGEPSPRQSAPDQAGPAIPPYPPIPTAAESPAQAAGKREFIFAAAVIACSVLLCNFVLYGGFHLGFAIAEVGMIVCCALYLKANGHRFDWYSGSLLGISVVIVAGFGRSDDSFVKAVMVLFLLTAVNLSLCLAARQNRRNPGVFSSLLDAPRALFMLGVGGMGASGKGLVRGIQASGTGGRKTGSVLLGLVISVPILIVMIPLLMDADAAFEGLLNLLPEIAVSEYLISALWGVLLAWVLYSRGVGMNRRNRPCQAESCRRGMNTLTVTTILSVVCVLYAVYLISQLAYFAGGFAGILPEEFTLAEYARRGFFEMAWLCAINLLLICGSVALIRREAPRFMRLCCLFIGAVTIFLVATASAKMFMYIGSYGLTRLRVLTEVIMLWLALTTLIVGVWLFKPALPYMKLVVLTAMVMGALVFWVDVDTVVARYNVNAYRSGKLETVDMDHMDTLGYGATPYIYQLVDDADPEISLRAKENLRRRRFTVEDFRQWNYVYARASAILKEFHGAEDQKLYDQLQSLLGFEIPRGTMIKASGCYQPEMVNGQQFFRIRFTPEDGAELEAMLQELEWNKAPMHVKLEWGVYGKGGFDSWFTDLYDIDSPSVNGYWMFRNLDPRIGDPSSPEGLLTRVDPHFWLVCYDSDRCTLDFFLLDLTTAEAEK